MEKVLALPLPFRWDAGLVLPFSCCSEQHLLCLPGHLPCRGGQGQQHHMHRAVGLGGDVHEWAGPGGLDVNTVAGRGGCRTSSEVLL